ncbi:MAG TPA: malto-oligosyltrehalose trehalohydrolase [Thermoanaerobaculia bacterium]|nr:malto-oligosyltrehalose trehalohydrolase [Thermoanaerobaculia bacterium]
MINPFRDRPQGAFPRPGGESLFRVWGPNAARVELFVDGAPPVAMRRDPDGVFSALVPAAEGTRYRYRLDGRELPDPASRFQPEGAGGPSEVVGPWDGWSDSSWKGVPLRDAVFYELHVGTFTRDGTFEAIIPRLRELADLGVTMIELLPIAQFPGTRNWGYDGVFPCAAQSSYGGPAGLRRLVDAAHGAGLGICLDVVYNHLGPEGNYLQLWGPYFTEKYRTPWGSALNFDDADSDAVRELFIASALMWIDEFHVDALRLDAVHAIYDQSAYPFLRELADRVHERARELGREVLLVPESDLNDPRLVREPKAGGLGLDAHWSDDFHHSLHTLLTGETAGYYRDFGRVSDLASVLSSSYASAGRYSAHRRRRHGAPARDLEGWRLVVSAQNHDQIGNRMNGERLATLVGFDQLKLAAGTLLLSPFLPLLFMGEEWGDPAPFLYFVSHEDPALVDAVRKGRREEFASFGWKEEPPDPQAEGTFERSRPDPSLRERPRHAALLELHRELLRLRRTIPAFGPGSAGATRTRPSEESLTLLVWREEGASAAILGINFAAEERELRVTPGRGSWTLAIETADRRWEGPGGTAPARLEGGVEAAISFPPYSLAAWVREPAD